MYPMFELLAKEKPYLYERLSQEQYLPLFKNMQDICGSDFCGKEPEMTPSEISLCYCVQLHPQKNGGALPTVAEIAAQLNVSVPAISRTLKKLEAKQYIKRTANENDRRIVHIALSEKGEQVLLKNFRTITDIMDKVLAKFTDEELETMLKLYVKFTTAVSQVVSETKQTL